MRILPLSLRALLFGAFVLIQPAAYAETLYFAPLPMEQPEEVVKNFKPMLSYLEKKLGVAIQIKYSTSYAEILEQFRLGQIDIAYLGPLPYVTLRDGYPQARPVVHFLEKSGQATYTCALISAGGALPRNMSKQRIALTQPLSTCGYLSTDNLIHKAGSEMKNNRYRYLDKHDEVALAVARGDFDFGGLKTAIAKKYAHLGIKVLSETAPLPSFALIANTRRMSPDTINALREALTTLEPAGKDQMLMSDWGGNLRYGSVMASNEDFDVVRQLRRSTQIPEKGNY